MKGKSEVEKGVLSASGEKESGRERMGKKRKGQENAHTRIMASLYA